MNSLLDVLEINFDLDTDIAIDIFNRDVANNNINYTYAPRKSVIDIADILAIRTVSSPAIDLSNINNSTTNVNNHANANPLSSTWTRLPARTVCVPNKAAPPHPQTQQLHQPTIQTSNLRTCIAQNAPSLPISSPTIPIAPRTRIHSVLQHRKIDPPMPNLNHTMQIYQNVPSSINNLHLTTITTTTTNTKPIGGSNATTRNVTLIPTTSQSKRQVRSAAKNSGRNKHMHDYRSCKHCSKKFLCDSKLKRHMLTHTGLKAFKCYCGNTFSQKSSMKTHTKKHAKDILEQGQTFDPKMELNSFPIASLLAPPNRKLRA